jgi:site-specific recombinase XerD
MNDVNILPKQLINFYEYMDKQGKSENTITNYISDLTVMLQYLKKVKSKSNSEIDIKNIKINNISDTFIKRITDSDLELFTTYLDKQGITKKSLARKMSSIRTFFSYLKGKAKIIEENPSLILETPKIAKRDPLVLTKEEADKLIDTMYDVDNKRDTCIITLFLHLGLRLSELINLDLNDIQGRKVNIIGKGNKQRKVYLDDDCLDTLSDYLDIREKLYINPLDDDSKNAIFISKVGKRIGKTAVQNIGKKYLKLSELNSEAHIHTLRHTCFTMMYKNGYQLLEIMKIAGHESINTTMLYVHLNDDDVQEAMINNNPFSRNNRETKLKIVK